MPPFTDKHILLGVTGSIAAFKAADLASKLAQAGARVDVILTTGAEKFVTPLTFQSVTGRRAYTESDLWGGEAHVLHVGLAHTADALVIAPCTANTLAKLAHGLADNLLTITALANRAPLVLAPAMDGGMFDAPATQANLATLIERGATVIGPAQGHLASGLTGKGRMVEPAEILGQLRLVLGRGGALAGQSVVVSAGGTQEPLDPVRVLTNRSSGKQGFALAQAALDAGAQVTLIATPTSLTPPVGAKVIHVETAREVLEAVLKESANADALIMAAAVADFRPKQAAASKMKKRDGIPQVALEATEDVLEAVARQKSRTKRPKVVVGFAAESRDLLSNASEKLKSKKLDMIAANDISADDAGFGVDTNRITLLFANGKQESLPLMSKIEVAETIVARIAALET
ncbi:MAG: bifunctional phosphopantothenoylcysteine decarboxylase/phosphopantothenate--cysteine ligase CoaBC [Chloroflexi bacterium]|nr:bifunctional phosphopantothenoylcysteine decarboxylase/phosphopantothenate--cysteine ligase CoaBC [Chloroflexota bacterium]